VVQINSGTYGRARLREAVDGASLIAAGTHCSSAKPPEQGKPVVDPEDDDYAFRLRDADLVRAQFVTFLATKWRLGPEEEKRRRRTIRL